MSYILEALKKSQRERELGQVPDLSTETFTDSTERESSVNPWIIGSVIMALLALLVALYAVFGLQSGKPETPVVTAAEPVPEQQALVAPVVKESQIENKASAVQEVPPPAEATMKPASGMAAASEPATRAAATGEKTEMPAPVEKSTLASSGNKPSGRQSELDKIRQEYARMQAEEKQLARKPAPPKLEKRKPVVAAASGLSTTSPAPPVQSEHPLIHELPTDMQSRIPPRNIILQSYSDDPEQRFVILNSTKLYQGQSTVDGLQVLEIRMDGLLLEFEGRKFFQPR